MLSDFIFFIFKQYNKPLDNETLCRPPVFRAF